MKNDCTGSRRNCRSFMVSLCAFESHGGSLMRKNEYLALRPQRKKLRQRLRDLCGRCARPLFLAVILFLAGCSTTSINTSKAHKWTETYGALFALTMAGDGFTFPFPQAPGHVNYITKASGPLKIGQTITVTFKITPLSGAKFATVQKNTGQASFRLMIMRDSDMTSPYGRYWSNPDSFVLRATGTITLSVPIKPERWSDVYGAFGTENLAEFKQTLSECGEAGITFGGTTGGFGHGDTADGKATFTLVSLKVQ
jgi:hypothetical protein